MTQESISSKLKDNLLRSEKTMINKYRTTLKYYEKRIIAGILWFVILTTPIFFIIGSIQDSVTIAFSGLVISYLLGILVGYIGSILLEWEAKKQRKRVYESMSQRRLLFDNINENSTINEILEMIKILYSIIQKDIDSIRKYKLRIFNEYMKNEVDFVFTILTDLRSDLQLRLAEQQKTLEQAKSEVEQNIHGTTELNQVSELQKARLDRQIEQFEELQRVLVKV